MLTCELQSRLPKGGIYTDSKGQYLGVSQGDTRSFDFSLYATSIVSIGYRNDRGGGGGGGVILGGVEYIVWETAVVSVS